MIRVAHRVSMTEAEGPGLRYALWTQGCPLRCPGCCNPEFLGSSGGVEWTVDNLLADIARVSVQTQAPTINAFAVDSTSQSFVEGISLLGGEPTIQPGIAKLAEGVQALGLSVMVYSGFTLEELQTTNMDLMAATDILVDGPYDRTQPETERRWVGSRNQRVHFLTDRYRAVDPCWRRPNTLEIRVRRGEVSVNGFPAKDAKGLWAGWK